MLGVGRGVGKSHRFAIKFGHEDRWFGCFNCRDYDGLGGVGAERSARLVINWRRHGRKPSIVRAGPEGLGVSSTGNARTLSIHFARDRIQNLFVQYKVSGKNLRLVLQVISDDDQMHSATFPWRAGQPMIEVEDNLRDVLGLPPLEAGPLHEGKARP